MSTTHLIRRGAAAAADACARAMAARAVSAAMLGGGVLLAGTALAAAAPADAPTVPYRTDTPAVLERAPQPKPDPAAEAAAFRAAYEKAGRPRATVYWNRALSDDPNTRYEDRATLTARTDASLRDEVRGTRTGVVRDVTAGAETTITATAGERQVNADTSRSGAAERVDWAIESAFKTRLIAAGLTLVDRAVALRTTGAATTPDARRDVQTLETDALLQKGDVLLEVLQTPDASAPFGYAFRVEAKDVKTGAVLASIVGDGRAPAAGPGRFVAGANGFVRATLPAQTPAQAGEVLADALVKQLTARWR